MAVRPVMIRNEDQFVQLMRGRRLALGLGQAELDDRIGWSPAYTSKVEAPHRRYGRRVFMFFTNLADEWLEGLGLALVLMDRREATKLCAESEATPIDQANVTHYPNRERDGGLLQSRTVRLTMTYRKAA